MDYTGHGILQARILEWVAYPFSSGSFDPRIEQGPPALQVDSLPTELSGKPYNLRAASETYQTKWVPSPTRSSQSADTPGCG